MPVSTDHSRSGDRLARVLTRLEANQPPDRFYLGGPKIAAFRGQAATSERIPEDWIGSATPLFGHQTLGQTALADGMLLADHIERDPVGWLGADHVAAHGTDTGLLVKLLDAGQRLPIHAHPDRPWAAEHLGLVHGKTESWIILEGGEMWLGFARPVDQAELLGWIESQDVAAMAAAMQRITVRPGDTVLVPAGTPHAIGQGVFVVELQEPTDLSILMEWHGFELDGAKDGHLGLGWDVAVTAVDRRARSQADVRALVTSGPGTVGDLYRGQAAEFFRAERYLVAGSTRLEAGFSIVVVVSGSGRLVAADGALEVDRGATILVPHGAGDLTVTGTLEIVRARPPR